MRVLPIPPQWHHLPQPATDRLHDATHPPPNPANISSMPDVGLPTLSSATTDAIASSTPTLENTWHAQGNDALHPSIVQRSIVKRITTGNRSTGRRLGYFRVSKYADVIRSIPKEEYARLGGLTGVALAYGVPRASLSQYVNADGELRDLGRARLDRTEHAFSLANLRQLQANGPALCAAAGGFAQLAVRLGVHANQLREVLTVDGKLRLRGRRRLNDNAELVSRKPDIPEQQFLDLLSNAPESKAAPSEVPAQPPAHARSPELAVSDQSAMPHETEIVQSTSAIQPTGNPACVAQIVARAIADARRNARTAALSSSASVGATSTFTVGATTMPKQGRQRGLSVAPGDLSNVRGANDTRDPVPTVVLHWYPGTPDVHAPSPSDLLFESEFADGSDAWIDRLLNSF